MVLVFKDLVEHKASFPFKAGQEKEWFALVDADKDGLIHRLELLAYLNGLKPVQTASKPFMHFVKDKVMAVNAFKSQGALGSS